jgi:hypothetical protein
VIGVHISHSGRQTTVAASDHLATCLTNSMSFVTEYLYLLLSSGKICSSILPWMNMHGHLICSHGSPTSGSSLHRRRAHLAAEHVAVLDHNTTCRDVPQLLPAPPAAACTESSECQHMLFRSRPFAYARAESRDSAESSLPSSHSGWQLALCWQAASWQQHDAPCSLAARHTVLTHITIAGPLTHHVSSHESTHWVILCPCLT